MMILDKELTRIYVEEQVIERQVSREAPPIEESIYFQATLDGESMDGHQIVMSRQGVTPDEAIKHLFEAMHNAEVTL